MRVQLYARVLPHHCRAFLSRAHARLLTIHTTNDSAAITLKNAILRTRLGILDFVNEMAIRSGNKKAIKAAKKIKTVKQLIKVVVMVDTFINRIIGLLAGGNCFLLGGEVLSLQRIVSDVKNSTGFVSMTAKESKNQQRFTDIVEAMQIKCGAKTLQTNWNTVGSNTNIAAATDYDYDYGNNFRDDNDYDYGDDNGTFTPNSQRLSFTRLQFSLVTLLTVSVCVVVCVYVCMCVRLCVCMSSFVPTEVRGPDRQRRMPQIALPGQPPRLCLPICGSPTAEPTPNCDSKAKCLMKKLKNSTFIQIPMLNDPKSVVVFKYAIPNVIPPPPPATPLMTLAGREKRATLAT